MTISLNATDIVLLDHRKRCYLATVSFANPTFTNQEEIMSQSLYERLGGTEGITRISSDVIDNHLANKTIATRFANSDVAKIKNAATTFFTTATGGPSVYKGKDMLAAHKGMNISAAEFMAVLDDGLAALQKNNVGQREQEEVLFALYSMRSQIVLV
jgi:hemoglobin